jgi:hypothetical protein
MAEDLANMHTRKYEENCNQMWYGKGGLRVLHNQEVC